MRKYYKYMKQTGNLSVGTYEANRLAALCGINTATLVFLGTRANATQAPIAIKDGWYIYELEERMVNEKPVYYVTIDNALKLL
ncbi:MAG: hypothetical protein WCR53_07940 [Bacteroidaceae bacterium]